MAAPIKVVSFILRIRSVLPPLKSSAFQRSVSENKSYLKQISSAKSLKWFSQDASSVESEYPQNIEVSYEEFRHVERILPAQTVPEPKDHSSFPTPSGWVPPIDEVRSKQAYLVRRTKNHMLPVYTSEKEVWGKMRHHVRIGKIEGDIWKLEAELRDHLKKKTQLQNIHTQVHEVSRCIRVRGQHADLIAEFLLERGM